MIIKDEFDKEFCQRMFDKYSKEKYSYYWKSSAGKNQFHWHLNLIDGGINQDVDMTNELLNSNKEDEKFIWETLKKYTSPNIKLRRLYVNAYTHGTDSLPHKDSMKHDEYTAIFYLNNNWKISWGGETVVYDSTNKVTLCELPGENKLIFFKGRDLHAARPISKICQDLRMVMVFKFQWEQPLTIKSEVYEYLNTLDLGISHSGRTFKDHLLGTYSILKDEGNPEYVCYAGLFHSIFGTSIFQVKTVDNGDKIRELIGNEAFELVEIFSQLDRPKCWDINTYELPTINSATIHVSKKQYRDLRTIDYANLREQKK